MVIGYRDNHTLAGEGATMGHIAERLGEGRLRVEIQQVLPLEAVADAHVTGERGYLRGRLVLDTTQGAVIRRAWLVGDVCGKR